MLSREYVSAHLSKAEMEPSQKMSDPPRPCPKLGKMVKWSREMEW